SGNNLTWIEVATVLTQNTSFNHIRCTLFKAQGSSPTTGTSTINFGGQTQTRAKIGWLEFTGTEVNTDCGVVVTNTVTGDNGNATSPSLTLNYPNAFVGNEDAGVAFFVSGNSGLTAADPQRSGWWEHHRWTSVVGTSIAGDSQFR